MGACWFCHWGWPKPVADIYEKYVALVGKTAMHYGPAHIVWEDENFADDNIDFCIKACDEPDPYNDNCTAEDCAIVKRSLIELRAVPETLRSEPEEFNDEYDDPADFPPPDGVEMVRKRAAEGIR